MRPTLPLEDKHRKLSDTSTLPDRPPPGPTTFFLSREPTTTKSTSDRQETSLSTSNPFSTLQDTIDEAGRLNKHSVPRSAEERRGSGSRRRSTIKPIPNDRSRRASSAVQDDNVADVVERSITPSPILSQNVSLPSSPKSVSSRSLRRSDEEGLTSDDGASQAIASSEEDEAEAAAVEDSQPDLIMPSIKMPSRRPFTSRGKQLGRFKILVAGQKGSGKTSLIKSIVQLCEDIVHVDPLSTTAGPAPIAAVSPANGSRQQIARPVITETYASTKPYPSWWSDLEESRVLRRRKSMGDAVLERNLCFVDTSSSTKLDHVIRYLEQQLTLARSAADLRSHDFASLLSGRGGTQVDVILYLVSNDRLEQDLERIQRLSEITNVIPLIARSDLLSHDEQTLIKQEIDSTTSALPRLPTFGSLAESTVMARAPYTSTSINGPDLDTMDASLLMSPEYVQPLLPSELGLLITQLFETDTIAYLKHTSARKLLTWQSSNPRLTRTPSPSAPSLRDSTLASPHPTSLSNSGILVPAGGSELSLNTSNSFALARVADHTQREEHFAQIRLSKWASDLQLSLQRERERYERIARDERAIWLIERMGEEVRGGQVVAFDQGNAAMMQQEHMEKGRSLNPGTVYQMHDPLGLLQWRESIRTRGWIALQVMGSFGVVGSLAFLLAKSWGLTSTLNDWAQEWSQNWFGMHE